MGKENERMPGEETAHPGFERGVVPRAEGGMGR